MAELKVFADKEALSQAFVDKVVGMADTALHPLKLALSGGSTPKRAYELLSKSDVDRSKLNLFMVDERYLPATDERSNERMMRAALGGSFRLHPMYRFGGVEEAASAYENVIRQQVDQFDLVLLGMGPDGHTASLFPEMLPEMSDGQWCVASKAPVVCPDRVTLTFAPICAAKETIFMVAGADKGDALKRVLEGPTDLEDLPAQYVALHSRHCEFWLDQATANAM